MEQVGVHNAGDATDAYNYYHAIADEAIQNSFQCLDNPSNEDGLMIKVQSSGTNNFVVDFSDATAWAATDIPSQGYKALFEAERPEALGTRWLNIWYPSQHSELLQLLARRYDFSPRLLALLSSDPRIPRNTSYSTLSKPKRSNKFWRSPESSFEIVEIEPEHSEFSEQSSILSSDSAVTGNLYKIASDMWHYTSVDFGRQFVCIGYNSLYGTKQGSHHNTRNGEDTTSPLPHCIRVWTWLILCEDNTVISINEDPFPFANGRFTSFQLCVLKETRRNLVNVFRSLCAVHSDPLAGHNPMLLLPIRVRLGDNPEETAHRSTDSPGLLFYYLFENWHNSYTLITRKESRYSTSLTSLRDEMLHRPTLNHIERLDRLGKELSVLRRHFTAYTRIIDRLLEPITPTAASLQNSHIAATSSMSTLRGPVVTERQSLMGVALSSAARMRFARLRDLISLYALSSVEEYIHQKENMVSMLFSLIAIKQSADVDRLTRITLLLTKATMIFLPVSLATSYFDIDLVGVEYTVQTYWLSFGVIMFVSWLALFLFGVWNGNVQTAAVIMALWAWVQAGGSWTVRKAKQVTGKRNM